MSEELQIPGEYTYKGIRYRLNRFGGYKIFSPVNIEYQPYAGNKLFDQTRREVAKSLKRRVRYQINKYLKENKGVSR